MRNLVAIKQPEANLSDFMPCKTHAISGKTHNDVTPQLVQNPHLSAIFRCR
ncbi:MAG: hypothetical protein GY753_05605 [Gammaproteobacteria bacterium]|nr:hypothetical protein [Gammaproteobacteria bacterium]